VQINDLLIGLLAHVRAKLYGEIEDLYTYRNIINGADVKLENGVYGAT
jgi:hypothetical protein